MPVRRPGGYIPHSRTAEASIFEESDLPFLQYIIDEINKAFDSELDKIKQSITGEDGNDYCSINIQNSKQPLPHTITCINKEYTRNLNYIANYSSFKFQVFSLPDYIEISDLKALLEFLANSSNAKSIVPDRFDSLLEKQRKLCRAQDAYNSLQETLDIEALEVAREVVLSYLRRLCVINNDAKGIINEGISIDDQYIFECMKKLMPMSNGEYQESYLAKRYDSLKGRIINNISSICLEHGLEFYPLSDQYVFQFGAPSNDQVPFVIPKSTINKIEKEIQIESDLSLARTHAINQKIIHDGKNEYTAAIYVLLMKIFPLISNTETRVYNGFIIEWLDGHGTVRSLYHKDASTRYYYNGQFKTEEFRRRLSNQYIGTNDPKTITVCIKKDSIENEQEYYTSILRLAANNIEDTSDSIIYTINKDFLFKLFIHEFEIINRTIAYNEDRKKEKAALDNKIKSQTLKPEPILFFKDQHK